ncbi:MAG TPA: hypothetical protein VGB16_05835 [candidate division Zixibacteria bacterium]
MIIRCTARFLKEMGLTKADLTSNTSEESELGEWYTNLFFVERKKCVIFTNARTLFTFIWFDVDRSEIRNLGKLFRIGFGKALLDEDFDGALIQHLVNECRDIRFAKTQDRSVLGVMVDHVKNTKWMVIRDGGLEKSDFSEIIKQLNRTPLLTKDFTYSIEELGKVLGVAVDTKLNFNPSNTFLSSSAPEIRDNKEQA